MLDSTIDGINVFNCGFEFQNITHVYVDAV